MDEVMVDVEEASRRLGVSRAFVYDRLIATGRLRTLKLGSRRLVPVAALDEFVVGLLDDAGSANGKR